MKRPYLSLVRIFAVVCIASAGIAVACQVPVFRYALERWAPAAYLVTVTPAESGLTDAEQKAVAALQSAPNDEANPVNLEVRIEPPAVGDRGPARLALLYPQKLRDTRKLPLWQAPLTDDNVRRLVDSPIRRELRRRLLAGESAIWVLVESGDRAKDDAAFASLSQALTEAESSLKLPDGVLTPAESAKRTGPRANEQAEVLRSDLPLKIAFSTLRVQRNDAQEVALLSMLAHLEDDLGDYAREPMVFPVFGRGRVIEPLIGAGIHKGNVIEHSGYLCGACSCEVKDQNPGIDLLMAANWEPVDTTPKVEVIRITPRAETAPVVRRPPVLAASASVVGLLLGAWLLIRVVRRSRTK